MEESRGIEDLLKHLECPVCLQLFEDPKELECHHILCKSCLDNILQFEEDGSGTIKCPQCCGNETVIGNKQTTNDLKSQLHLKCMVEEWWLKIERERNDSTKMCPRHSENRIFAFCTNCQCYMCNKCKDDHVTDAPKHRILPIMITRDKRLKVPCQLHKTNCNFMCCDTEHVCLYCVKRSHKDHNFLPLESETEKIQAFLDGEIMKMEDFIKLVALDKQNILDAQEMFDKYLINQKEKCLLSYKALLNTAEEQLRSEFKHLTISHTKKLGSYSVDPLTELKKLSEFELGMLKEDVLMTISKVRRPNTFRCVTVSLRDNSFLSEHALGDLEVDYTETLVADAMDLTIFKFNRDSGLRDSWHHSEGDSSPVSTPNVSDGTYIPPGIAVNVQQPPFQPLHSQPPSSAPPASNTTLPKPVKRSQPLHSQPSRSAPPGLSPIVNDFIQSLYSQPPRSAPPASNTTLSKPVNRSQPLDSQPSRSPPRSAPSAANITLPKPPIFDKDGQPWLEACSASQPPRSAPPASNTTLSKPVNRSQPLHSQPSRSAPPAANTTLLKPVNHSQPLHSQPYGSAPPPPGLAPVVNNFIQSLHSQPSRSAVPGLAPAVNDFIQSLYSQPPRSAPSAANITLPKPPIFDKDGQPWLEACSADGKVYYFKADSRETRWDKP